MPDTFVDLWQMREDAFNQWTGELLHAALGRTQLPELLNRIGAFAAMKVAPEMILKHGAPCHSSFTHGYRRSSASTLVIAKAARAASVPRFISFSRQRFLACSSSLRLRTA